MPRIIPDHCLQLLQSCSARRPYVVCLVPKLCLGTDVLETLFRERRQHTKRSFAEAFPSGVWERGGRGNTSQTQVKAPAYSAALRARLGREAVPASWKTCCHSSRSQRRGKAARIRQPSGSQ